jgi:hypothetical protein
MKKGYKDIVIELLYKMGIYSNGSIFGLRIYNFNEDDISNTLFEEKFCEIMSHEQMREAYLFYNELQDKNNISFKIYTECSSTLNKDTENFMDWYPMSLNSFLEKFQPVAFQGYNPESIAISSK